MVDFKLILAALKLQQQQLQAAISLFEKFSNAGTTKTKRRGRKMSASARAKIAAAQRKRWKLWKSKQK